MQRFWTFPLAAIFVLPSFASEYNVQVSPVNARIVWQLGGSVHTSHGTFQLKKGDLWFDPETRKARGELVVDAASGESGNGLRDGRMRSSILEVKKFPDITFRPDQIIGTVDMHGPCEVKLHGLFNIHGQDHELTIPAKLIFNGTNVNAVLNFEIPYVEWGMKDPSTFMLRVDKVVKLEIKAEGHVGQGL